MYYRNGESDDNRKEFSMKLSIDITDITVDVWNQKLDNNKEG